MEPKLKRLFGGALAAMVLAGGMATLAARPGSSGQPPATTSATPRQASKLDRFLEDALAKDTQASLRVLVQVRDGEALGRVAAQLHTQGHPVHARMPDARLLVTTVRAADLRGLEASADVVRLSVDAIASSDASMNSSSPICMTCRMIRTLGLDYWAATASGVGVAVIDSGIEATGELPISAFYDFTRGGIKTTAYDDFGHGTHVASLVASSGKNSGNQFRGVAPGVKLIGLKVLDARGGGYTSTVIAAIDFAIDEQVPRSRSTS